MCRAKGILIVIGAIVALLITWEVAFTQCAMCKTALLASPEGQEMAKSFNNAILFLLGMTYLVIGTIAFLIFNAQRRHRQRRKQGGDYSTLT